MSQYIDHTKKKSVIYMELLASIADNLQVVGASAAVIAQNLSNLNDTVRSRPMEGNYVAGSIQAAMAPLVEFGKAAHPFLKEICSNEFVSAITSRNAELEKNNVALQLELKELRERLNLDSGEARELPPPRPLDSGAGTY